LESNQGWVRPFTRTVGRPSGLGGILPQAFGAIAATNDTNLPNADFSLVWIASELRRSTGMALHFKPAA
jgi:hypothetical protein